MRNLLGRLRRSGSRSLVEQLATLTSVGDGSTLSLDFTTGVLDPRLTFTRASNATFINSSGQVQYADANMMRNSSWSDSNPVPQSWSGAGNTPTIPDTGSRTFTVTTAATSYIAEGGSSATGSQGVVYTAAVEVTAVSGSPAYNNTILATASPTGVSWYRNGTPVNGTDAVQTGVIACVFTSGSGSFVRVGLGASGGSVTNQSITMTKPRLMPGNRVDSPYFPSASATDPYQAPRFDHDPTTLAPRGLLIEGQAVNIMFRSQAINTSPWFNAGTMTVSETGSGSPANDATSNVVTWNNGTGAGSAWLQQNVTVSAGNLVVGTAYTWSVWLKSRGGRRVNVFANLQGVTGNREVRVDFGVSPPTVTSAVATGWTSIQTPTIVEYPNGWYKVTTGGTLPAGTTSVNFGFSNSDAVPASGTNGFEAWGYQLEAGSGASSYIPTGSGQGTRNADVCYMANADYGFSTSGGTYLAEWHRGSIISTAGGGTNAFATDYASGRWLGIYTIGAGSTGVAGSWAGYLNSPGAVSGINKMAVSYSSWVASASGNTSLNGGAIVSGTLTLGTTPTYLFVGAASGTSPYSGGGYRDPLNNCVRRIKYWPSVLPNAQLQSLTT